MNFRQRRVVGSGRWGRFLVVNRDSDECIGEFSPVEIRVGKRYGQVSGSC